MPVARVKIRDRGDGDGGERIRFNSALLPRWARRTRSLDSLLPVLYLRGVSTGDFKEALAAILGKHAPNLAFGSRTADSEWQAEYERWRARDLSARRYVYPAMSTSGPTASTCRRGWRSMPNACWC